MEKTLIIAEKSSLAMAVIKALKAFNKQNGYYENDKYIVSWAKGHLFELYNVEKYLGVDKMAWKDTKLPFIPQDFKFGLKNDDEIKRRYEILKELVNREDVKEIVNCGDAEREGQIIIDLIIANIGTNKPVKRLWLPEQTEETIKKQVNNLPDNSKYKNLHDEGLARTYLDWLLGINITRYLTIKAGTLLRAGRVLIPVVKFVYDREMLIKNFKPETYYQLESTLKVGDIDLLLSIKDKKFGIDEEEKAQRIATELNKNKAIVTKIEKKETRKYPSKLFSLDNLQGLLSKNYKINFSTSMKAIQSLYMKGYLTYPRTNSEYMGEAEKDKVKEILSKLSDFDVEFKDTKKIFNDSKIESHSAITITTKIPDIEKDITDETEKIVYKTVFNRFISNFLKEDTIIDQVIVTLKVADEVFEFKGESIKQEGFLKYEPQKIENNLPQLEEEEKFEVDFKPVKKKTTAPKKATEDELGNFLKNPFRSEKTTEDEEYKAIFEGIEIGTNATRTGIIENAIDINYISRKNSNLSLEPLGEKLIEVLDKLNINLYKEKTVEFSKILKKVYKGEKKIEEVIEMAEKELEQIIKTEIEIEKIAKNDLKEEIGKCPICKKPIYEGKTKTGKITYSCSGYKEGCKFTLWETMNFNKENQVKLTVPKVKKLLEGKTIPAKLKSTAGNEYEANLKLVVENNYPNLRFDSFVKSKKKK